MVKKQLWQVWIVGLVWLLAACGGDNAPSADHAGSACPAPNPRLEVSSTELNLFVWTEYIPQRTVDCFEEVYGIRVNREEYSSSEELYAKLSVGSASYDLVQPTDYIVNLMIRQGLLQELDRSRLPVLNNFDPNYLDLPFDPGNRYTIPYQAGSDGIVVNTAAVENLPQSYADLWKPEYAGRLVLLDDSRAIIGATLLALGYNVYTQDPAQLAEAKTKLAELAQGVKLFDSDSPKNALMAGDVDLGIVWTGEALLAQREVPSIEYVYPSEGVILWQDSYAIPAEAPHLDAAYAWLNYSLQGDLFWQMLEEFPYTNPNLAALEYARQNHPELYTSYVESPITNTPSDVLEKGHYLQDVGEATLIYDRIWTEIKGE